ncbi:DUF4377 domain-containing protein [Sphingobacterium deserti]|uniref:DUF4377 domain-containing protein n=1 Tax=Sphingobacterium deserti TaxID=1229276 RepID=A0A0B8T330_9SPHI|nr:DUF4377 domain-containing protein [Sphingobacterium deserti]KGE13383.1 hypothetical protein DI53_2914 [Sphingobacterium deserti]
MKTRPIINFALFVLILSASCSKEDSDRTYVTQLQIEPTIEYIAPHPPARPDLPKDIPALRVRENNDQEYYLGLHEIDGFIFEEGYRYNIEVQITILANPPIDGNPKTYKFLDIISKE